MTCLHHFQGYSNTHYQCMHCQETIQIDQFDQWRHQHPWITEYCIICMQENNEMFQYYKEKK